jgi:hypothetical protein
MTDWTLSNEGLQQATVRYATMAHDLRPGVRRYNAFWSAFEGPVPSSPTPMASCPPGYTATPANETDRVARGYRRFHCYHDAQLVR